MMNDDGSDTGEKQLFPTCLFTSVSNTNSWCKHGVFTESNSKFRKKMEDTFTAIENFNGHSNSLYCVFDGHGGSGAAIFSSENFHHNLLKVINESEETNEMNILNDAFLFTDDLISRQKIYSGCTAAVAWFCQKPCEQQSVDSKNQHLHKQQQQQSSYERLLITGNAGDSRIVLSRSGSPIRLTCDHKAATNKDEQCRIKEFGGFIAHGRVNGIYAITRSLGDMDFKEILLGNPYVTKTELTNDDEFLIIASDGLWDVVSDEIAVSLVHTAFPLPFDCQAAAKKLGKYALENGSTDNITIIVVDCKL